MATACPAAPDGRLANDRPGRLVVDEALLWYAETQSGAIFPLGAPVRTSLALRQPAGSGPGATPGARRGTTTMSRRRIVRWADCSTAWRDARATTLVVVAGDHGEAFGEHGEISHSLFTYDTTLRVPLIMSGAGVTGHDVVVKDPVSLVDVAPTIVSRRRGVVRCRRRAICRRPSAGRRSRRARSTRSRSRRSSISAGARSARCAAAAGSTSQRRTRSSTTCATIPGETQNKISAEPQRAAEMRAEDRRDLACDAGRRKRHPRIRKRIARLQALGYTGGPPGRAGNPGRPEGSPGSGRAARGDHVRRAAGRRAGAGAPRQY